MKAESCVREEKEKRKKRREEKKKGRKRKEKVGRDADPGASGRGYQFWWSSGGVFRFGHGGAPMGVAATGLSWERRQRLEQRRLIFVDPL